ncbi:hypothetical protein CPC16_011156 [Podila verticillata]|nr:hypothetical protein CPC16_011156 [Podila verticillata]
MPPKKKVDQALEAKLKEIIAISNRIEAREEFEEEEYSSIKYCNAIDIYEDYIDEQQALLRELNHHNVKVPCKCKLKGPEPRAHSYAHSLEIEEVKPDPAQLKQLIVSALQERKTIPVYKDISFVTFENLPLFRSCIKRPKLDLGSLEGQTENPFAIIYLVNMFFDEHEVALKTLLSKKLFDDDVQ